jgi:hypothetical protein
MQALAIPTASPIRQSLSTTAGDVTSTEPEKNLAALKPAESVESEEEAAGTTYVSQRRKRSKQTS